MVAGNPFKRSFANDFPSQAVSFVCLDYGGSGAGGEWNYLPDHACPDGIRAQVFFPSCWDGVNVDSSDHKSHVVYPESGAYNGGTCPSSHPVQLVSIFFEVIFDTPKFTFWQGDYGTKQPFVMGMGDPTGYGFHGDFINGWDVPTLQKAVDTCTNDSGSMTDCHALELQTGDEMSACTIPSSVNEDITGPLDKLPGCNPVAAGPGDAAPVTNCAATPISGPQIPFTDVTSLGWAYQGCATDDVNSRTLTGTSNIYSADQATTDVESCIKSCLGSTYAGLEYGKQCFCGNSVAADRAPQASQFGSCNLPCAGNSSQICGGGSQLSLYKVCASGSSCTNAAYQPIGDLSGGTSSGSSSGSGSSSSSAAGGQTGSSSSVPTPSSASSSLKAPSTSVYPQASSSAAPADNQGLSSSHVPMNPPKGGSAPSLYPASNQAIAATTTTSKQAKAAATTTSYGAGPGTKFVTVTDVVYVTELVTVTPSASPSGTKARKQHRHNKKRHG